MKNKELRLAIKKLIQGSLEGTFTSIVLDPAGEDISHSRDFSVGDDPRKIEILATFESGHVTLFEKNLEVGANLYFVIDGSASLLFSSSGVSKLDRSLEFTALICRACLGEGNRFSFLLFTDHSEYESGLVGSSIDIEQKMDELRRIKPKSKTSSLKSVLRAFYLNVQDRQPSKPSLIFIISDFLFETDFKLELSAISEHSDVIAVILQDPAEISLPKPRLGLVRLTDSETGETFMARMASSSIDNMAPLLKRCGVDSLVLNTGLAGKALENLSELFERKREEY